MEEDLVHRGMPERVTATLRDAKAPRLTPTGGNTKKAYFYNTAQQIKKADRAKHQDVVRIIKAGKGGDNDNPTVEFEDMRNAQGK